MVLASCVVTGLHDFCTLELELRRVRAAHRASYALLVESERAARAHVMSLFDASGVTCVKLDEGCYVRLVCRDRPCALTEDVVVRAVSRVCRDWDPHAAAPDATTLNEFLDRVLSCVREERGKTQVRRLEVMKRCGGGGRPRGGDDVAVRVVSLQDAPVPVSSGLKAWRDALLRKRSCLSSHRATLASLISRRASLLNGEVRDYIRGLGCHGQLVRMGPVQMRLGHRVKLTRPPLLVRHVRAALCECWDTLVGGGGGGGDHEGHGVDPAASFQDSLLSSLRSRISQDTRSVDHFFIRGPRVFGGTGAPVGGPVGGAHDADVTSDDEADDESDGGL